MSKFNYINCICCGKELNLCENYNNLTRMGLDMATSNWKNGGISKISFGYGSLCDGDEYYIGICDKCIDINFQNGRARYSSNSYGQRRSKSEIEKANKTRERNRNLNSLLGSTE